jgi:hypothetical protein
MVMHRMIRTTAATDGAILILLATMLLSCAETQMRVTDDNQRPIQRWTGTENVRVITPTDLIDCTVLLDDIPVGFIWPKEDLESAERGFLLHMMTEWTEPTAGLTKITASKGQHTLVIVRGEQEVVRKTIDVRNGPVIVVILSEDVKR